MKAFTVALALALTYLILTGSANAMNFLAGLLIGATIALTVVADRGRFRGGTRLLTGAPKFLLGTLREIWRGAGKMLVVVLRDKAQQPGFVDVSTAGWSEQGVAMSALVASMAPGSVFIDVDGERDKMVLHVIDAADAAATRAEIKRFYEDVQKPFLP